MSEQNKQIKFSGKWFRPFILIFVLLNAFVFGSRSWLQHRGVDADVLLIANILFLLLAIAAFMLQRKAMNNPNPNVFVRGVISTMMIRMFIVAIAAVAYALLAGETFNRPAVFISLFIYLLYLAAEVGVIMKLNRSKNG